MNKLNYDRILTFLISILCIWITMPFFRGVFSQFLNRCFFIAVSFLILLFMFLLNSKWITNRILKIVFGAFVFLFIQVLYIFFGYGDGTINQIISFIFVPFFMMISLFCRDNLKNKENKFILIVSLISFLITLCTSIRVLLVDPYASRLLTSTATNTDLYRHYQALNVSSLDLVYGSILLIPFLLNKNVDIFKQKKISRFFCILLAVMISFMIILANFLTAYFLLLAILIASILKINKKNFIIIATVYMVFLILFISFDFSSVILNMFSEISNIGSTENKIFRIQAALNGNGSIEDTTVRFRMISDSINTFFEHPIIGYGAYYSLTNGKIGGHSSLFDDLARFGIFVSFLLYSSYFLYFKYFYKNSNKKYELIVFVLGYAFILITNPGYGYGIVLCSFLLVPLLSKNYRGGENENFISNR